MTTAPTEHERGRKLAQQLYSLPDKCDLCDRPAAHRHHISGDPTNNTRENIQFLCARCHMTIDGRLERARNRLRAIAHSLNEAKRSRTHCPRGHEYTPENTYQRKENGARRCRACAREDQRRYEARQRERKD